MLGLRVLTFGMRYSGRMCKAPYSIAAFACVCLLTMQLSGLHLHVNPDDNGGLHGTHVHDTDHDGHGHEADTDVSLIKFIWSSRIIMIVI